MARSVRSDEPIKKLIVLHLKALVGCNKVTLVAEIKPNVFRAHCIYAPTKGAKGSSLGFYTIDMNDQLYPACEYVGKYVS